MGYNNNNAGMHMIWYHRRNAYDDLEYYDRLVERKQKQKELARKVLEMEKEEKADINPTVDVEQAKPQPSKKEKEKPQNKNNNSKPQQIERPKKEAVIDDEYFKNTIGWYANIYLIAFERKLDIFDAICECEHLCKEDLRMSDGYGNIFDPVTVLDKAIVFLNMLADKMGCDVYEFIFPNEEMRSRRLYRILDKLDERYCVSNSVVCAFEYGVAGEREDEADEEHIIERFELNEYMYLDMYLDTYLDIENLPECHMGYYFNKITTKDGSEDPIYTCSVMTKEHYISSRRSQVFNFMYSGSDIISENEGRLAEFFEKLKKIYFENGGTKNNHLFDLF